ncbi:MAG: AfsR/SARP family transcriptional regulator, partial [Micromonosporaceae bacterium]
ALAGLARLLAEEDPEQAATLAARAVATASGISAVAALVAAAWVAHTGGDSETAIRHARDAAAAAEARRDRPGLAGALTVQAAATADSGTALPLTERALELWRTVADPIGAAQTQLVRAAHLEEPQARTVLEDVRSRMRAIGCRQLDAAAEAALSRLTPTPVRTVELQTLGGFRLLRDGQVVPFSAWKSRKARELVKILLSRRGRPTTVEQLTDLLWPGEASSAVANRLNVLVSTVRSLFDPDRRYGTDGFLVTEGNVLRLRMDRIDVDTERFLADATAGIRLLREGRTADGVERLSRAEAGYTGDFLEEDPYADWAAPLREEIWATYREVAARLARYAQERDDSDAAVRLLLRILERDPYDEQSHLNLVSVLTRSGRHGDARRHYRGYCVRMEELGVEAAPFLPSAR